MSTMITDVNPMKPADVVHTEKGIQAEAPLTWLKKGIADFRRIPGLSLLYGSIFAAVCALVFYLARSAPWFTLAYITGLVMMGPFLAAGLYAASRDIERGVDPSIASSLRSLGQRKTYLGLFALMLALVMAAWVRFSALLFALSFDSLAPYADAGTGVLYGLDGWFAVSYFAGVGLLLVAAVFTVSAVAIPMILDKHIDFITAIQNSCRAVFRNPAAMIVWALTIGGLTVVGIATAFVGLAVIFPVLGYATWHSYRELIR